MCFNLLRAVVVLCLLLMGSISYAQEPVSHFSQFATVISLVQKAQKAQATQEDIVSGAVQLNNMLGGAGQYKSLLLDSGDIATKDRYDLLDQKKLSLGGADESSLMNYVEANNLIDNTLLFSGGSSYTDEQIQTITNNQNQAVTDMALNGMSYSMGVKSVSSQHGAEAVDIDAITSSVTGANNLQEVFQVLTASDRQILSSALTLASTEATIALLMATKTLQGVSATPSTAADVNTNSDRKETANEAEGSANVVTGGSPVALEGVKSAVDEAVTATDKVSLGIQKESDTLLKDEKNGG